MGRFLSWVTMTHSARYHAHHGTAGQGHLYQGRYKSFPIESDEHFLTACRYVERNALAAKLAKRAEEWRWGSLWNWCGGESQVRLADWPVTRLTKWVERVNAPLTENDLAQFQLSLLRGCPYGSEKWVDKTVKRCGLESTLRPRGRPKKID
jgi:putative transposase